MQFISAIITLAKYLLSLRKPKAEKQLSNQKILCATWGDNNILSDLLVNILKTTIIFNNIY